MTRFVHGVGSGEPGQTSVSIWTRVTTSEATVPLRWVVEPDDDTDRADDDGVRAGTAIASHRHDHTVTVIVDGLAPGQWYRYRFEAGDGGVSSVGRTRTIPSAAAAYRIGFTSCARYGLGYFTAYRMLAEERCDLVIHLGDYTYEDADMWLADRLPDPGHEAVTLADYRRRHATHRRDPDLQALHHAAPMVPIWDDHDVANSAPADSDPAARQRRRDGQQAWREWLPVSGDGSGDDAIDRVLSVPGLVDLAVVDARFDGRASHRRPTGPSLEPVRDRRILSDEQWDVLARTLRASTAPWRIVANQVQIGPMRLGYLPSLFGGGYRALVNADQWDGYRAERRRLYDLVRAAGPTLLVSGDLHSSWYRTLTHRGESVAPELTVTSVAGELYGEAFRLRTMLSPGLLRRLILALNRGIEHLDLCRHGYALVDVSADRLDVTAVLLDTVTQRATSVERVHLGGLVASGASSSAAGS